MVKRRFLSLALAAGLICSSATEAWSALAADDSVRARLIVRADGTYQVVLRLSRLTRNDRIVSPLRDAGVAGISTATAVRRLQLLRDRNPLRQRIVITLSRSFGLRVLRGDRAVTHFAYRFRDACNRASCGIGFSRARVTLNVVSAN